MRSKETQTFTLRKPERNITFSLETYTRPDDSKFYTYTFDNITPDTFIDLTLQANFWKFPCCVHVYSKNHNYHCLHFDRFTDFHQFFRGWKLATDDIRMVQRHPHLLVKLLQQSKGTKHAKRRLKQVSGREARFRTNENHCISKYLVAKAKDTNCAIALEDLSGINSRTTVRKKQRAERLSWSRLSGK